MNEASKREVLSDAQIIEICKAMPFMVGGPYTDTVAFARVIESTILACAAGDGTTPAATPAPTREHHEFWPNNYAPGTPERRS